LIPGLRCKRSASIFILYLFPHYHSSRLIPLDNIISTITMYILYVRVNQSERGTNILLVASGASDEGVSNIFSRPIGRHITHYATHGLKHSFAMELYCSGVSVNQRPNYHILVRHWFTHASCLFKKAKHKYATHWSNVRNMKPLAHTYFHCYDEVESRRARESSTIPWK
jgi:hypothetical protein